ncbi:hypothetical protein LMG26788_00377 [Achromobacter pulmonis]|uniref:Uncharacterized protein n=1 Tax=Achromobacter pulmonis TaxID=1389932 RepID=A0A6S7CBB4_9BURK|nr:hypothetical protein LMG26788_00377 [Achromobacter pulmonis]
MIAFIASILEKSIFWGNTNGATGSMHKKAFFATKWIVRALRKTEMCA